MCAFARNGENSRLCIARPALEPEPICAWLGANDDLKQGQAERASTTMPQSCHYDTARTPLASDTMDALHPNECYIVHGSLRTNYAAQAPSEMPQGAPKQGYDTAGKRHSAMRVSMQPHGRGWTEAGSSSTHSNLTSLTCGGSNHHGIETSGALSLSQLQG